MGSSQDHPRAAVGKLTTRSLVFVGTSLVIIIALLFWAQLLNNELYSRDVGHLRALNRELLLLNAESDPLYKAFKKAFPGASPVELPFNGPGEDAVRFIETVDEEGRPATSFFCTVAPRDTRTGLAVVVEVEKAAMERTESGMSYGERTDVSVDDLTKIAETSASRATTAPANRCR